MKILIVFWGVLIILICNAVASAQMPEWYLQIKKIKILQDTREDIIKVLGEPNNSVFEYDASYKYDDHIIYVHYSHGVCENTKEEGWNVPKFTVTNIFIQFYKKMNYQKFNLKLKNLDREEIYDVPNAYTYYDYEKGESYGINSRGLLESVDFKPGRKSNYLFCENRRL